MLASLQGDKIAYEKFLSRVANLILGYLVNTLSPRVGHEETANDLVQDVLLAIHRKKHLYRSDLPIIPWLFAIARYKLIDHNRSDSRRPLLTDWENLPDPVDVPVGRLTDERLFELEELLSKLPARQREILVLAKAEGIPLMEIATKLNMSLSAVKVSIHRALGKLRGSN